MQRYSYHARDLEGGQLRGEVIALNPEEAADILRESGVYATSILPERGAAHSRARGRWIVMPRQERTMILSSWETLLRSGFPMQSALQELRRLTRHAPVKKALYEVQQCIDRGSTLTQALAVSHFFPDSWISLIELGEKRGDYVGPLQLLIRHSQEMWRVKKEFISMLLMPAIILALGVIWLWVYLIHVVPTLLAFVNEMGGSLPMAGLLAAYSPLIMNLVLGSFLAACVLSLIIVKSGRADQTMGLIQMWLPTWVPLVGPLVSKMHLIVITAELRLQLEAGIPVIEAVRHLSQSVPHPAVRRDLAAAYQRLREGMTVPEAMAVVDVIPPMGHTLIYIGDSCGKLSEMLGLLVKETTQDLMHGVKRLTTVLRNLLILATGVMVGLLAVATFVLIYRNLYFVTETAYRFPVG